MGKIPLGKFSFGKIFIWEVATWEISHLGSCPWENAFGKVPNTLSSGPPIKRGVWRINKGTIIAYPQVTFKRELKIEDNQI